MGGVIIQNATEAEGGNEVEVIAMLDKSKRSFFFAVLAIFIICEAFLIQINPAVFDKSVSTIMTERKWWPDIDWRRQLFGGSEEEEVEEEEEDKGDRGYDPFADMVYEAEARLRTFNIYDANYPARAARFDAMRKRNSLRKR